MKGIYTKSAIKNVVEPLKAISSVFANDVHVVYENEPDAMFIGVTNQNKTIRSLFKLNVSDLIGEYGIPATEIGIWDVKNFTDILGKYQSDIYTEDVTVDCDGKKMTITCGKERTEYYTTELHLFDDIRFKQRNFKSGSLDKACGFRLEGADLKKIITNINVFSTQNQIEFVGKKGDDFVTVKISSDSGVFNRNELIIENVNVDFDFKMRFPKTDFKGLFLCNDYFDFNIYTGRKSVVEALYSKNEYDMNFYFSPIDDG